MSSAATNNSSAPPSMQYRMRRDEREVDHAHAESILYQGEFGVLCTCGADGVPYGVPINFVYDGKYIAFHSATEGHKIRNIQQNLCASFTVVGKTELLPGKFSTRYESAIAFGYLARVEGERKFAILRALVEKYSPDFREKAQAYIQHDVHKTSVFELEVIRLSGKSHR